MSLRPLIPREQAARDVDDAVACHLGQDAPAAALGLIDALAYAFITRQAAAGSARWAHELKLRGLRAWRLSRCPHLAFYIEQAAHIDVWRVLQEQRDIPAWLAGQDTP